MWLAALSYSSAVPFSKLFGHSHIFSNRLDIAGISQPHKQNTNRCNLKIEFRVGIQRSWGVDPISCPNSQTGACRVFWKIKSHLRYLFYTIDSLLFWLFQYTTKVSEAKVSFPCENGIGIIKSLDLDIFNDSNWRLHELNIIPYTSVHR